MRCGAKFCPWAGAEASGGPVVPGAVTRSPVPVGVMAGTDVAPADVPCRTLALGSGGRFSMRAGPSRGASGSGESGAQSQRQCCKQPVKRHDGNRS